MNELKELLKLIKADNRCFIFGDFSYDLFENNNANVNDFLDTVFNNRFYSLVNKPTQIRDTSAALLDHIWTNLFSSDIKAGVLLYSTSDHIPVLTYFYTKETSLKQEIKTKSLNQSVA